ncbi:MAG: MG2 domain-containing protein [Planctomycetota bacterium]
MWLFTRFAFLPGLAAASLLLALVVPFVSKEDSVTDSKRLAKLLKDGNYKEAYAGYSKRLLDGISVADEVQQDLDRAADCLQNLGQESELDAFREELLARRPDDWRVLWAVGRSYYLRNHYGFLVSGEFQRGHHRGGGEYTNSLERDRVRALQLLTQATEKQPKDASPDLAGSLSLDLADALLATSQGYQAWRLQVLTDLSQLPDLDPGYGSRYGRSQSYAPVDADGQPVFHRLPESFAAAQSDGERWRFALDQAGRLSDSHLANALWRRAEFNNSQFSVTTMDFPAAIDPAQETDLKNSPYALESLQENETIARLATGTRRFQLPDEFNHLMLYRTLAEMKRSGTGTLALERLARIFENRRQLGKAAALWKQLAEMEKNSETRKNYERQWRQIVGNWGEFQPVMTQPARKGATIDFRYRNGDKVVLEAHAILINLLLKDARDYLKSNPGRIDQQKIELDQIGYRLVTENEVRYVGKRVAQWEQKLEPAADHHERRITLATPLSAAGAYLLTSKMEDGNTSKIVLWVADMTIAQKLLDQGTWYFVADAVNGTPIEGATVEFVSYRSVRQEGNRYSVTLKEFAEHTDRDGQVVLKESDLPRGQSWLAVAHTETGRLAYLGFAGVWYQPYEKGQYQSRRTFTLSDRPVYRPDQTVHFKCWLGTPRYDNDDPSEFAGREVALEIKNPRNETVLKEKYTCDAYGGLAGSLELPVGAVLGNYRFEVDGSSAGGFMVEEYKKPEFEVSVETPSRPVALGEKLNVKVAARYYFGAPVVQATVSYKVLRTTATRTWFPDAPWDWLYGKGYWWFGTDSSWYPGFRHWGCLPPAPPWWGGSYEQPEVVAEGEAPIGADGTLQIEIDSGPALALMGDRDHRYAITAEVTDQSRRTIVGHGSVSATREPFQVTVWTDGGHYQVGDPIEAHAAARTVDGKPVSGTGTLNLYRIRYTKDGPDEILMRTQPAEFGEDGRFDVRLEAAKPGQYRLSITLADARERSVEGAALLTIRGEGAVSSDFRFSGIELTPDRMEYHPGEKVKLLVSTARDDSVVALFLRPVNGVYLPPEIVRLRGNSQLVELDVTTADMPNFFVEAITFSDGKLLEATRMIAVPPEKRLLNVAIQPEKGELLPGEETSVTLTLTDQEGKPFVGSTVVSIYDKALEYISGGSNIPSLKKLFWEWRRSHRPSTACSLSRTSYRPIPKDGEIMSRIGRFGGLEQLDEKLRELGYVGGDDSAPKGPGGPGAGGMEKLALGRSAVFSTSGGLPESEAGDGVVLTSRYADFDAGEDSSAAPDVEPTIRKEFADTALFEGALVTDVAGKVTVKVTMPDNLTTWRVRSWSLGHGFRVGEGEGELITTKNLLLRLQAPRFFTEKDEVVLSANVHNKLEQAKDVRVVLELDGDGLKLFGDPERTVKIDAEGEARVDFRVQVVREGEAVVRMKALTNVESDAMEMRFPIHVHGMQKMDAFSGVLRPDDSAEKVTFSIPEERRPAASRLELRYSPTLAGAMVDALPYLAEYPYGCTEQTLNRFLPTVITQKILIGMGLDLAAIQEKRTNLNAQQIGDDKQRAEEWQRFDRNPVFDEKTVRDMANQGLRRLQDMQLSDGGWGWFSGYGENSWPHTTATVAHGLLIARENDLALLPGVLERGVEWLKNYQAAEVQKLENAATKTKPYKSHVSNLDALVFSVLVEAEQPNPAMEKWLYEDKNELSLYSKALLGLALHRLERTEQLEMILRNLGQYLEQDEENQTAWLKLPQEWSWYWYGSEMETQATYLKLLALTDPKGQTTSRLVKYLVNNRQHGIYWKSTRDTALAIESLAEYLKASGETRPDMTVTILLDGEQKKQVRITPEDLFSFDNKLVLEGEAVTSGSHSLEVRREGQGPVYFNLYSSYFTLEDPITATGLELKIDRAVYRLVKEEATRQAAGATGQVLDQKVEKYRREKLADLSEVTSGDLLEVELTIHSKNDYEYVILEDVKAAGCEAVEINSGYTNNGLGAYMELRDRTVSFFVQNLLRGDHSLKYRLRAEIPGRFSALPARAYAMYAPELKGNSDEIKLVIQDRN